MTLEELKKMIAEEYSAYSKKLKEQALPAPGISVSDKDVDATGGDEDAEATLKDIYDMLKDYFEKDDAADDASDAADDDADDAEAMDEGMGMYDEDEKEVKKEGKDDDEKEKKEESKQLQERFQKLANIIK